MPVDEAHRAEWKRRRVDLEAKTENLQLWGKGDWGLKKELSDLPLLNMRVTSVMVEYAV